jgi:capsid protein
MSSAKARRAAQRALTASAPPVASAAAPWSGGFVPAAGFGGAGNGHQGADFSRLRGMVYFPELDTRREISSYTRLEILRRSRFLYANYGIAKRIINGLARMIAGTGLTYQAATSDAEWNTLAEKAYARVTRSRHLYDLGGRYTGTTSQQAILRFRFRDGDCGQVLTRDPETGTARFAFYEGHQIGTAYEASTIGANAGWRDGVLHGPMNNPLAYRILGDAADYADVPARSMLWQIDYERAGQSRGLSILSHAINHLVDAAEITGYIKTGVKLSNRHGYWIETAPESQAPVTAAQRAQGGAAIQTIQTPAGPINLERIYGAGEIPNLAPGQSIKFNSSSNPHPNQLTLLDYLIRDVAWGANVSPELLWNITALGGANTRFVLADAQGFIDVGQQQLIDDKLQLEMEFVLACEMQAGRLRPCRDPEWWRALWIPPPRITVDFGRDGKLYLEQVKSGALTFRRFHGWQGNDSEAEQRQWVREYLSWGKVAKEEAQRLQMPEPSSAEIDSIRSLIYGRAGVAPGAQPASPDAAESPAESPSDVAGQFSALLKKPGAAEALMQQLSRLPD